MPLTWALQAQKGRIRMVVNGYLGKLANINPDDEFVLAGFTQFDFWSAPWGLQADFVAKVAANTKPAAGDLVSAIRILLKYKAMPYHSFNKRLPDSEKYWTNWPCYYKPP